MALTQILGITYHQDFASLGVSAPYMVNIYFSTCRFDRVNRVNPSLLGTSLLAVDLPLKNPVIY